MMRQVRVGSAIVGVALMVQGCLENDEYPLTLLGDGGCRTADGDEGKPHLSFGAVSRRM